MGLSFISSILVLFAAVNPSTVALVAAMAGPLVTYFIAARRFSGKIATSDAAQLWTESRDIRNWSQARITELNALVSRLEARVDALESGNLDLQRENLDLAKQLVEARKHIAELEATHA